MQVSSPETAQASGTLESTAPRRALAGFFVSGVLLSFLGSAAAQAKLDAWLARQGAAA